MFYLYGLLDLFQTERWRTHTDGAGVLGDASIMSTGTVAVVGAVVETGELLTLRQQFYTAHNMQGHLKKVKQDDILSFLWIAGTTLYSPNSTINNFTFSPIYIFSHVLQIIYL